MRGYFQPESCHCKPAGCRSCTVGDYEVDYKSCNGWSNSRKVTITKHAATECVDIEGYDSEVVIPCEYSTVGSSAGVTIIVLAGTIILCSVAGIAWVFIHR